MSGAVWDVLLDLAAVQARGWTLVGAQMVVLHGHERGRMLDRATADADVLVDVRLIQDGTRPVDIQRGERTGQIPCPDLLGAILVKARAVEVDDLPDAQRGDLAFLLSLVEDPRQLSAELRGRERSWLRRRAELLDRGHPAWKTLASEVAANGYAALRILTS